MTGIARAKGIGPAGLEVWFGDEARTAQNNTPGGGPGRAPGPGGPPDQRTASTYIFGAIRPKEGKGAALVMPWCNTEAMALHLAAVPQKIEPGRHAVLLLDQAGWHVSAKLLVPEPRKSRCDFADITIVPLPAKCPELNPQENVWQFMRDNWLSNRVFTSYENSVDHCCAAWNRLVDAPWTIMSLGLRDWAHEF